MSFMFLFYFYVLFYVYFFYVFLRFLFFLLDVDTQILHEMQMQTVMLKKLTDVDIAAYIKQFVNADLVCITRIYHM